jgi:DNA-binding HxlR family transcriptional regulator
VGKLKKARVKREISEEVDLLDTMLSSLVELLEEKGIITEEEYERRIKESVKINK